MQDSIHNWAKKVIYGKLVRYEVKRDRELYDGMVFPRLKKFWFGNVVARVPPEPVTLADTKKLYSANGKTIKATEEIEKTFHELENVQDEIKRKKELIEKSIIGLKQTSK